MRHLNDPTALRSALTHVSRLVEGIGNRLDKVREGIKAGPDQADVLHNLNNAQMLVGFAAHELAHLLEE